MVRCIVYRSEEQYKVLLKALHGSCVQGKGTTVVCRSNPTLDLQRCSLRLGLYDKNSKFMPIKIV